MQLVFLDFCEVKVHQYSFPCFVSLELPGCLHKVFNSMTLYFIGTCSLGGPIALGFFCTYFTPSTFFSVWSLTLKGIFVGYVDSVEPRWYQRLHILLSTPCIFQCASTLLPKLAAVLELACHAFQ